MKHPLVLTFVLGVGCGHDGTNLAAKEEGLAQNDKNLVSAYVPSVSSASARVSEGHRVGKTLEPKSAFVNCPTASLIASGIFITGMNLLSQHLCLPAQIHRLLQVICRFLPLRA